MGKAWTDVFCSLLGCRSAGCRLDHFQRVRNVQRPLASLICFGDQVTGFEPTDRRLNWAQLQICLRDEVPMSCQRLLSRTVWPPLPTTNGRGELGRFAATQGYYSRYRHSVHFDARVMGGRYRRLAILAIGLAALTSLAAPGSAERHGGTKGDLRSRGINEGYAEHEHHHPGPARPSFFVQIAPLFRALVKRIPFRLIAFRGLSAIVNAMSDSPQVQLVRGNQSEKSAAIRMRKHRWVCDAGRA
jgi:hypothetical protein